MAQINLKKLIDSANDPTAPRIHLRPEQIEKLKDVTGIVLSILAIAGMLTVIAIAPNALIGIDKLFLRKSRRKLNSKEKRQKLAQAFYYMKRSGLIKMNHSGKDFKVFLTELGRRRLKGLDFETLAVKPAKRWDGKWWQVAADIPTKEHKSDADAFRQKIKGMDFFPLQRTLWFHPFDPRREVEVIANYYGIGNFVTVMEVSRVDRQDEARLKDFFREKKLI